VLLPLQEEEGEVVVVVVVAAAAGAAGEGSMEGITWVLRVMLSRHPLSALVKQEEREGVVIEAMVAVGKGEEVGSCLSLNEFFFP
jgi:hypothetical protein